MAAMPPSSNVPQQVASICFGQKVVANHHRIGILKLNASMIRAEVRRWMLGRWPTNSHRNGTSCKEAPRCVACITLVALFLSVHPSYRRLIARRHWACLTLESEEEETKAKKKKTSEKWDNGEYRYLVGHGTTNPLHDTDELVCSVLISPDTGRVVRAALIDYPHHTDCPSIRVFCEPVLAALDPRS